MAHEDDERLGDFEDEFKRYQKQKARGVGGVERRVLLNLAMFVGEQWTWYEQGAIKNKRPSIDPDTGAISEVSLVLNFIEDDWDKVYGRLTASTPEFEAFPDQPDPKKMAKAEVVTSSIRAGDERLDEDFLRAQRWFWMAMGGVAFEHTPWRQDLEVATVDKSSEDGQPLFVHIPTEEEMTPDLMEQAIEEKRALPEHFKRATEVELDGDYDAEILGPLTVFCPNSIKRLRELQPGQSVMLANVRVLDWVKKTWPDVDYEEMEITGDTDVSILSTRMSESVSFSNTSLHDLIPVIQGSMDEDDPDMVTLIERYEPVSEEFPPGWSQQPDARERAGLLDEDGNDNEKSMGLVVAEDNTDSGGANFAHGGRYSVFIPGQGVVRDGEIPYADGIPVRDFHWSTSSTNFWGPDWITKLIGVQKSINTLASQMRMMGNARMYDPILTTEDAKIPDTSRPRFWVGGMEDGVKQAERLGADQLPQWPQKQLEYLVETLHSLAGGKDLFQEKGFPGQIRGTGAVQQLQDIQDSMWGPKLRHYYKQMGAVYHTRTNRMKQFYPVSKMLRLTDPLGKVEVLDFQADEILRAGVDFYITVDPSSILPETRRERFARMSELLQGPLSVLYLNEDTQRFNVQAIASDLQFGDYKGREAAMAQDQKFALGIITAMKEGKPVIPFNEVQNHPVFVDELKRTMNDDDYWLLLSPDTQQAIQARYGEHTQFMAQQMEQAQSAQNNEEMASAVNQAVQASMAKVQSEVTDAVLAQITDLAQNDPQRLMALLQQQGQEQPQ